MALSLMIWIMVITGFAGGVVNYLMPSNLDSVNPGKRKQNALESIAIGIGATLLVPLFLEIAQSKLLENIRPGNQLTEHSTIIKKDTTAVADNNPVLADSLKRDTCACGGTVPGVLTETFAANTAGTTDSRKPDDPPLKNYLLFAAYCFLAATAGYKFIANVSSNILKDKELHEVKTELQKTETDLKKTEDEKARLETVNAENEHLKKLEETQKIINAPRVDKKITNITLPPITNPSDPQKGRFGGKPENNHRVLKADVKQSHIPEFYIVSIWVESTDPDNYPLTDEVFFYLHDTFMPWMYSITPVNNKAMDDEIMSYGAFTVGAITDKGNTFLELDLAEQTQFPQGFRDN